MALTLEQKKQVVAEVSEIARGAYSAVAAEYRGLTVSELTDLRVKAREAKVYVRVVKNRLAKIAVRDTEFECMQDSFVGPLILAFSTEDLGSAARLAKDFAKDHENFKVTAISVAGHLYGPAELERVSKLPTRDEAIAMFMGTLRAPVDKFARTLNEVPSKLVRTFAALKDKREEAG